MMNEVESQVYNTLSELDSLDKLTELFCSHLNYDYSGCVLSKRDWKEEVAVSAQSLQLVATHDDFHIIYCETEKLLLGIERPIINQILRQYPYTLIVFSDSSYQNWHLVNIRYDEEVRNRRLFRRIAVGPDERLHTAAQRINLLDVTDESMTALDLQKKHDKAFDVEEVTKEFFNTFVDMFHLLRKELAENNPTYAARADEEAQILLDRLMFLYFIQKKGWLDGKKDYLYQKFLEIEKKGGNDSTFYQQTLLPLFQALSNPDPGYRKHLGDIPFLNGGLFEVSPFYSKLPYSLKIPNTVFKSIFNDLLERFNFTVREDTPLDVEVAIDPEMLGRVFENLILQLEKDKDLRKITGSYYTPRVVVHFMCQQSLKEYLFSEWFRGFTPSPVEPGRLPLKSTSPQKELSDMLLEKQEEEHRKKIEFLYALNPADQLSEEEINQLHAQITINDARVLRELIRKAYILDPAVGSGAFLVGILHEMISIIKLLDLREFGSEKIAQPSNYTYELKREIIENCLYGVDIQEQAVRICELRLWLSLVVDYEREGGEDVPPLPNLSYKVRCGDSLIEKLFGHNVQLDQLVRTNRGRQLIDEIREDKEAYFLTRDIEEKKKKELAILYKQCELAEMLIREKRSWLKGFGGVQSTVFGETAKERQQREEKRKELEEYDMTLYQAENTKKKVQAMLQRKVITFLDDIPRLRQSLGLSFIWKLDFAEVFKEKGGFDIVIANPPYVSFGLRDVGKAKGEWADYMRKNYPNSAEYKLSIYAIFMDKGLQLLRDKGILSFITPDSFLLGRYFSKLRGFVLRACRIKEIAMFEKDFWQAGVVGRPVISNIQRYSDTNARSVKSVHCLTSALCSSIDKLERGTLRSFSYEQRYFEGVPHNRFRLFFEPREKAIVEKLESNSEKLSEAVTFSSGLIGRTGKKEIISDKRLGEKWHPGLLSGREIKQYCINYEGNFTLFDTKKLKSGFKDARYFEPKIFLRQTGDSLVAAYDTENFLCLNNLHVGNLANSKYDLRYVLAMLNSKLMNYYYHLISLELGRTMAQIDIETIELLPIKPVPLEVQNQFIGLVDKIMAIYNQSEAPLSSNNSERITELERRIDFKIYELYGLTSEEIRLIEESA